ncbi:hypothetical protein J4H92_14370 [Leucobacter weissii]|uniref:Uncharacterized protein n=1 Tax=Leucobacter weissii TaxID=1983706 RepID=A0A939MR93_9MICO|nr:hypothetical protein [Leucobacter weissii]MBO1903126.1 hypothetical protein [Leucobacter weissii]
MSDACRAPSYPPARSTSTSRVYRVFQANFSPRYHYELEVEYPGAAGQLLIGKVKIDNAPVIARTEPFDGTVWVSQLDPRDISVEPTGRKVRSFRLVILTGLCLAAGFALLIYDGIEYVSTWFEQNVVS